MIRIFLADDHDLVRQGLRFLLEQNPEIKIVGEASSGAETLRKLKEVDADVALLDLSFADRTGLEVLSELQSQKSKTKVIFLTMHAEDQFAVDAVRAGALGYFTKSVDPQTLFEGIRTAAKGQMFLSPEVASQLKKAIDLDHEPPSHNKLSPREFQIFCLIASGKSLPEIGKELGISMKTVSVFRSKIIEKMKLKNNVEITRYAVRHKLVSL